MSSQRKTVRNFDPGIRNVFGVLAQGAHSRCVLRNIHPSQSITRDQAVNLVAHVIWLMGIEEQEITPVLSEVAARYPEAGLDAAPPPPPPPVARIGRRSVATPQAAPVRRGAPVAAAPVAAPRRAYAPPPAAAAPEAELVDEHDPADDAPPPAV